MPFFCWKNLSTWKYVVHRQIYSSSIMDSACKADLSTRMSSLFITNDLQGFINWYISEKTMSKLMRVSMDWRLTDFNNCMKWSEFHLQLYYISTLCVLHHRFVYCIFSCYISWTHPGVRCLYSCCYVVMYGYWSSVAWPVSDCTVSYRPVLSSERAPY
jgi:hypothetical protein